MTRSSWHQTRIVVAGLLTVFMIVAQVVGWIVDPAALMLVCGVVAALGAYDLTSQRPPPLDARRTAALTRLAELRAEMADMLDDVTWMERTNELEVENDIEPTDYTAEREAAEDRLEVIRAEVDALEAGLLPKPIDPNLPGVKGPPGVDGSRGPVPVYPPDNLSPHGGLRGTECAYCGHPPHNYEGTHVYQPPEEVRRLIGMLRADEARRITDLDGPDDTIVTIVGGDGSRYELPLPVAKPLLAHPEPLPPPRRLGGCTCTPGVAKLREYERDRACPVHGFRLR